MDAASRVRREMSDDHQERNKDSVRAHARSGSLGEYPKPAACNGSDANTQLKRSSRCDNAIAGYREPALADFWVFSIEPGAG